MGTQLLVAVVLAAGAPCPSGTTLSRTNTSQLCRTSDGTLDGPVSLSWDSGKPKLTGRFERGQPSGAFTWWHENGKKRASYTFGPAGTPTGTWESWFANGKPQWLVTFRDGVPDGPVRAARDDGSRRFEGAFAKGQRSGAWTAWYRGAGKAGEGAYASDRPNGAWRVWWKSGALAGTRDASASRFTAPDGGTFSRDELAAAQRPPAPESGPFAMVAFVEASPVDQGPPEFVPPLWVPTGLRDPWFPWGSLDAIWFDEFRIELGLDRETLD